MFRVLQGKRGSSPQQGKGVAKSTRSSNKGGGSRGKSRASQAPATQLDASWRIKALVSTAASFDLDMPETILGSGECGYVFGCRCGAPIYLLHCSIARCRDSVRCQLSADLSGARAGAMRGLGFRRERMWHALNTLHSLLIAPVCATVMGLAAAY